MKKLKKSEKSGEMIVYRIGDYTKYMGVTPDFLKHYQKFGLIKPIVQENRYRYYPFDQSYRILECMRLRNYGFSIRKIDDLLHDHTLYEEQEQMALQVKKLENQIAFQQRIVNDYAAFKNWLAFLDGQKTNWSIEEQEEMLFLPHTSMRNFIKDDLIYEVLSSWIDEMPMVKSCMEIKSPLVLSPKEYNIREYSWGLIVPSQYAYENNLPINKIVKRLPKHKTFRFHVSNFSWLNHEETPYQLALNKMEQLRLNPIGNAYFTVYMYAQVDTLANCCGSFSIQIEQ